MFRKRHARTLGAALWLAALALPMRAEPGGMPSEIEWKLAELGSVVNPPETAKLYTALHEKEPYQGVKVARDIKYGTDERPLSALSAPEPPAASPRPVLMFVHGGAFTRGGRRSPPGGPFYDHITLFGGGYRHG